MSEMKIKAKLSFDLTIGEDDVAQIERMLSFSQEHRPTHEGGQLLDTFKRLMIKVGDHRGLLGNLVTTPTDRTKQDHPLSLEEDDNIENMVEDPTALAQDQGADAGAVPPPWDAEIASGDTEMLEPGSGPPPETELGEALEALDEEIEEADPEFEQDVEDDVE